MNDTEIIILAAAPGKRMRSLQAKSLLLLKKETIVERQIRLIEERFPDSTVKVVIGFKSDKFIRYVKTLKTKLNIIPCLNKDWENITPARSIALYRDCKKNLLVLNGDIVFSSKLLHVNFDDSGFICTKKYLENTEIGCSNIDGYAGYFAYSFPDKFGQIFYLTKRDADAFCGISNSAKHKMSLIPEIFNQMIDEGSYFKIYRPHNGKILDVDKLSDLERASRIA